MKNNIHILSSNYKEIDDIPNFRKNKTNQIISNIDNLKDINAIDNKLFYYEINNEINKLIKKIDELQKEILKEELLQIDSEELKTQIKEIVI